MSTPITPGTMSTLKTHGTMSTRITHGTMSTRLLRKIARAVYDFGFEVVDQEESKVRSTKHTGQLMYEMKKELEVEGGVARKVLRGVVFQKVVFGSNKHIYLIDGIDYNDTLTRRYFVFIRHMLLHGTKNVKDKTFEEIVTILETTTDEEFKRFIDLLKYEISTVAFLWAKPVGDSVKCVSGQHCGRQNVLINF